MIIEIFLIFMCCLTTATIISMIIGLYEEKENNRLLRVLLENREIEKKGKREKPKRKRGRPPKKRDPGTEPGAKEKGPVF